MHCEDVVLDRALDPGRPLLNPLIGHLGRVPDEKDGDPARHEVRRYVLFEVSGANPDHLLKGNESLPVVWRHSAEQYPALRAFAVDLYGVALLDSTFGCLNLEDEVTQAAPPFELRRFGQRQKNMLRLVRGERVHVGRVLREDQIT